MARQTQKLKGPYLWALVLIILSGLGVSGTVVLHHPNPVAGQEYCRASS